MEIKEKNYKRGVDLAIYGKMIKHGNNIGGLRGACELKSDKIFEANGAGGASDSNSPKKQADSALHWLLAPMYWTGLNSCETPGRNVRE